MEEAIDMIREIYEDAVDFRFVISKPLEPSDLNLNRNGRQNRLSIPDGQISQTFLNGLNNGERLLLQSHDPVHAEIILFGFGQVEVMPYQIKFCSWSQRHCIRGENWVYFVNSLNFEQGNFVTLFSFRAGGGALKFALFDE